MDILLPVIQKLIKIANAIFFRFHCVRVTLIELDFSRVHATLYVGLSVDPSVRNIIELQLLIVLKIGHVL